MGVRAVFASAGDGDIPPAGGRGLLGHFDDHHLFSFSIFPKMQKAPTFCFRKTPALGGTDDLVLGAVPFLKGRQKRPNCFSQKGRTAGRWIWFVRASRACALFQLMVKQKGRRVGGCR